MEESGRVMVGHTGPSCHLGKNERKENKSLYLMDVMIDPTLFLLNQTNQLQILKILIGLFILWSSNHMLSCAP